MNSSTCLLTREVPKSWLPGFLLAGGVLLLSACADSASQACGECSGSTGGTSSGETTTGGTTASSGADMCDPCEPGTTAGGGISSGAASSSGGAATGGGTGAMNDRGGTPGTSSTTGSGAMSGGGSDQGSGGGSASRGACASPELRVTEVNLGEVYEQSESEVSLKPLALSPIPSGGSRLAYMGDDGAVHVAELDGSDQLVGTPVSFPAWDFADIAATDSGGVLLLTREAEGGGTLNCGDPSNLCGEPPDPPVPCYDMYMVGFDGESETWATKLTDSSANLPPYSTGPTGPTVTMIWWYAHHGRLATDGTNTAGYFGAAISVSEDGCINIHQGDRMKVVGSDGELLDHQDGFDWGCSHSGYEHVLYDDRAAEFVSVCKTDNQNRIAIAPTYDTVRPVDLAYSNLSDHIRAQNGGYWVLTSDAQSGQPELQDGLAEVHLLHFTDGMADQDVVVAGSAELNARAPHLAEYGTDHMLAAWETSTALGDLQQSDPERRFYVQVRDRGTGQSVTEPIEVDIVGNRYQAMRGYPDGSVAYAAPGDSNTLVEIFRALPCE